MRNAQLMGEVPPAARPPVLCYHRVGGQLEVGVTRVAKSVFARQMTTLARAGWKTLTLDQFAERLQPGHSAFRTPHSAFLLTFDDGYASLAEHVYPILADVGFTATTFLITDHVGRLNTWDVRYTWHRLGHLDWDTIGMPQPVPRVAHIPRALHVAPAGASRLGHHRAVAGTGLRLRLAHRLAPTAHVAVRRPGSCRARAVARDAASPPRTRGGAGRRLSVRGPGRADRAAGQYSGI